MRLIPPEIAIRILEDAFEEGIYPDPRNAFEGKAGALAFLRELTEEDFGMDTAKWRAWFERCPRDMLDLHYEEMDRKTKLRAAGTSKLACHGRAPKG